MTGHPICIEKVACHQRLDLIWINKNVLRKVALQNRWPVIGVGLFGRSDCTCIYNTSTATYSSTELHNALTFPATVITYCTDVHAHLVTRILWLKCHQNHADVFQTKNTLWRFICRFWQTKCHRQGTKCTVTWIVLFNGHPNLVSLLLRHTCKKSKVYENIKLLHTWVYM